VARFPGLHRRNGAPVADPADTQVLLPADQARRVAGLKLAG